jgi:hypothetical protein
VKEACGVFNAFDVSEDRRDYQGSSKTMLVVDQKFHESKQLETKSF